MVPEYEQHPKPFDQFSDKAERGYLASLAIGLILLALIGSATCFPDGSSCESGEVQLDLIGLVESDGCSSIGGARDPSRTTTGSVAMNAE